jgi:ABC-type multidrug transport system fused ATPase/permease subunit
VSNLHKIIIILDKKYYLRYFYLFALLLIGGILEFFSLTSAVPIILNLTNANVNFSVNYLQFFFDYLNKLDLLLLVIVFVILNIIKNLYLIFISYYKEKFTFNLYQDLSSGLFLRYLNQNLTFYFQNNATFLNNNVINEVRLFVKFIDSYLIILLEILIVTFFLIILFFVNLKITILAIFSLLFFLYLFKLLTKNFLIASAYNRQNADYKLSLTLNESFRNIKMIKLNSNNEYVYKLFLADNKVWSRSMLINNFVNSIPKFSLEMFISVIIFIFIFYLSSFKIEKNELIVIGSFFLISIYRMLPSFNRITSSIQTIISATAVVERLFNEFSNTKLYLKNLEYKESFLIFSKNIKIKDLTFSYNIKKEIFSKINFTIKKGSIFGIIGKSGVGKSTLVDLIMGFLEPQRGEVLIDDVFNIKNNLDNWQKKIGYVSQRIFLNDDSIKNNIVFGYKSLDENNQLNKVIYQTQLNNLIDNKKISLDHKIGEQGIQLSGGQIQRIAIARALFRGPELLILDEATSGLDVESESKILEFIKQIKDITVIIISHRNTIRNYCDDVIELD